MCIRIQTLHLIGLLIGHVSRSKILISQCLIMTQIQHTMRGQSIFSLVEISVVQLHIYCTKVLVAKLPITVIYICQL